MLSVQFVDWEDNPVTARRSAGTAPNGAARFLAAIGRAVVAHVVVAIVALLGAFAGAIAAVGARAGLPRRGADPAVALGWPRDFDDARGGTAVAAIRVAIVTLLASADPTIAADCLAGNTYSGAVITCLKLAAWVTTVVSRRVSVVAGFTGIKVAVAADDRVNAL